MHKRSIFRTVTYPRPCTASSSPRLGFTTTPTQNFNRYYLRNG